MPKIENLGSAPIPFTLELDAGGGTDAWVSTQLLPAHMTGRLTGIVLDCDANANLSSCVVYALSGEGAVSAQPNDRARAFESAALSPAVDAPDAFLDEVVDRPQSFRGLRVALFATWTGAVTINGVVHTDRVS